MERTGPVARPSRPCSTATDAVAGVAPWARNTGGTPVPHRGATLRHHHELRLHLLPDVRAGDVDRTTGGDGFVLDLAVGGQPLLPAREEIVELGRAHRLGEIGVPPYRDHPAD